MPGSCFSNTWPWLKCCPFSRRHLEPNWFPPFPKPMLARKAEKQRETNIQVSMIPKELAKCIWFPGFGCRLPSRNHLSGTHSCGPDIFRLRNMYKSHNIEYKSGDFRSTWMVTWKVFFRLVGTERNFRFRYPLGCYNIKRFHDLHLKVCFVAGFQHCTEPPGPNGVSTTTKWKNFILLPSVSWTRLCAKGDGHTRSA